MDNIEMDVKNLNDNNVSLKKKLIDANVTFQNHEKYWTDKLNVLKEKNKQELEFMTKNHEALQVH